MYNFNSLDQMEFLASIDRYINMRRLFGSEPSIGAADGASVNLPHVFFVDSVHGASTNAGVTPDRAVTTVTLALAQCTAGRGDVIICLPGHVETIATASGIVCSKAGVSIIGIGTGTDRPTFTWSATGSTWLISGANVTLKNILCTSTIAAMVKLFSVTGAYATFDQVDYVEDGTTDALQFILTTATADFLTVRNCSWYRGATAASTTSAWIGLVGADFCKILDNYGILKSTANNVDGFIVGATTLSAGVEIGRNRFYMSASNAGIAISMLASSTGYIYENFVGSGKTAIAGQVAAANCYCANNFVNNTVNVSGLLDPVVDS